MSNLPLFDTVENPHVLLTWEDYNVRQTQNFIIPMDDLSKEDFSLLQECHDKYIGDTIEEQPPSLMKLQSYVRVEKTGRFFKYHIDMTKPMRNEKMYVIQYIFISGDGR